jgi:hypothetical protein
MYLGALTLPSLNDIDFKLRSLTRWTRLCGPVI